MTSERPESRWDQQPRPKAGAGWTIVSYLIGGMILYGGIGWLVGRWTGVPVLFPVGLLVGLALSLLLVIFRFRST